MCALCMTVTKWKLTPTLRVATFSHRNKFGHDILVDTSKRRICRHGENSSTIRTWLQAEERARKEGKPVPKRNSVCDCQNSHGLQNNTDTRPPPPPACLFDVLDDSESNQANVGEPEPARRLTVGDNNSAFLSANGQMFCTAHLTKLPPLTRAKHPRAFKAFPDAKCSCAFMLPHRALRIRLGRPLPSA